jgi:hypothetical protein
MPRKKHRSHTIAYEISLPDDESIAQTAQSLLTNVTLSAKAPKYAPVRHLLCLIGTGVDASEQSLPQYNPFYVKRTLIRLYKQKFIAKTGKAYRLTARGKRWILKYTLKELTIPKPRAWDGKWRMIIYDVARYKASLRNIFRRTLKKLGFYSMQESVWLYPYPCEKEIGFLRRFCGMGEDVIYVIAHKIENDAVYKFHFGLK